VRQLLQKIIDARDLLIPLSRRDLLEAAWNDFMQQWDSLLGQLAQHQYQPQQLEQAGLTGSQLTMKLHGFWKAWEAFNWFVGRKRLKRVLEWINMILGSLGKVVPLVEALKELKEAIEEDLRPPP
jgi:hypothetical protein